MSFIIQIRDLVGLLSNYTPTATLMVLLVISPILIGGMYIFAVSMQSDKAQQSVSQCTLSLPKGAVQRKKVVREALGIVIAMYSLSLMVMFCVLAYGIKNISTERAYEISDFVLALSYKHDDLIFTVPKAIADGKYQQYLSYMEDGKLSNIEFLILKKDFNQAMLLYIQNDQPEQTYPVQAKLVNLKNTANNHQL